MLGASLPLAAWHVCRPPTCAVLARADMCPVGAVIWSTAVHLQHRLLPPAAGLHHAYWHGSRSVS
eukprot:3974888-Lingulodinium_polyedra.AAC.1